MSTSVVHYNIIMISVSTCQLRSWTTLKLIHSHAWEKVRKALGKGKSAPGTNSTITAEMLNDNYSNVSTDPNYQASTLKSTAPQPEAFFSEMQIFHLLKFKTDLSILQAPALWNALPHHLCSQSHSLLSLSSSQFHKQLKTHLFLHSYPP